MAQTHDADWFAARLPTSEKLDALLDGDPVAALTDLARSRAPVEMGVMDPRNPEEDPQTLALLTLAADAAKKLKATRNPTLLPEEVEALHALVHLVARPALRVHGGDVPAIPQSWPRLEAARDSIARRLPGVGRLDTHDRQPQGTGWFIAPDLLVTNNHVVAALCGISPHFHPDWRDRLEAAWPDHDRLWREHPDSRPLWDPGDSPTAADTPAARVAGISMIHPMHDMAFLPVEGVVDSGRLVLPLAAAPSGEPIDLDYYLAGYPAVLADQIAGFHPALVGLLFDGADDVVHKRVSPGGLVDVSPPEADHDASTLGGSSGSPVIDLGTHRVVGLHHSGVYGERNRAVALWKVQDDTVFSDHGITFT